MLCVKVISLNYKTFAEVIRYLIVLLLNYHKGFGSILTRYYFLLHLLFGYLSIINLIYFFFFIHYLN